VEKNGSFRITGIPLDRFRLTIYPLPENVFLKSMRSQQVELEDHVIEVDSGALEIGLSGKKGSVSGAVLTSGDQPASGAVVVLIARNARAVTVRVEENGHAAIRLTALSAN
jgi:hypothetical protein